MRVQELGEKLSKLKEITLKAARGEVSDLSVIQATQIAKSLSFLTESQLKEIIENIGSVKEGDRIIYTLEDKEGKRPLFSKRSGVGEVVMKICKPYLKKEPKSLTEQLGEFWKKVKKAARKIEPALRGFIKKAEKKWKQRAAEAEALKRKGRWNEAIKKKFASMGWYLAQLGAELALLVVKGVKWLWDRIKKGARWVWNKLDKLLGGATEPKELEMAA